MPSYAITVRRIAAVVVACGLCVASAAAGPFSGLVVFGDSLSDVGNIAQATLDIYPGPYYDNDRFSNGPVWVEELSIDLGFGAIQRSTAGGNDFAYGGAQTTGTGGFNGIFIRDVDEQVSQFLNTRTVDPGALFVVYAGANDLLGGQTNVSVPVGSLVNDIGRLVAAGARQFLVPTLPLLGFTPRFNDNPTLAAQYDLRSEQFNAGLDAALDGLAAGNLELVFYRLDVAALFADAIADPAAYGLANVTDAAAPGLEPGDSSYNTSQIVPNPNQYLFWDEVHPTATVHAVLAERARMLLLGLPGDYNEDGVVDAADYTVWRDNVGAPAGTLPNDGDGGVIGPAQYGTWKANFGITSSSLASVSTTSVPEPTNLLLLIEAIAAWLASISGAASLRRGKVVASGSSPSTAQGSRSPVSAFGGRGVASATRGRRDLL
jgi:phospholipase/lecithinase/hemolysin